MEADGVAFGVEEVALPGHTDEGEFGHKNGILEEFEAIILAFWLGVEVINRAKVAGYFIIVYNHI